MGRFVQTRGKAENGAYSNALEAGIHSLNPASSLFRPSSGRKSPASSRPALDHAPLVGEPS